MNVFNLVDTKTQISCCLKYYRVYALKLILHLSEKMRLAYKKLTPVPCALRLNAPPAF